MKSRAIKSFWDGYHALPAEIQKIADKQYRLWIANPSHPSIQFKKVGRYWSARITDDYRAVGVKDGDTIIWFWVGTHGAYDRLLRTR
jgi:hypothetical protein